MDLDKFARKIQNYLQNNPLVVLGSGSSVPFGLPTMGFLSTILKDTALYNFYAASEVDEASLHKA